MRSILITGGAGFIGSCLVRQMVGQRLFRVVNLDKLTYAGNLDSLDAVLRRPAARLRPGRHRRSRSWSAGCSTSIGRAAIVNLAAESHVDRSIDGPAAFVETNVVGTFRAAAKRRARYWQRLAEPARREFRFLHVSTDEVYGSLGPSGAFTETTPYAPNSPYSASKAASDHFVRAYHHTYGLPTLTTNCSNNYGPYQFPEKLIPLMILNALEGKPLPVYGDGQNVRDWLFVEDHCRALLAVLERGRPGEVYNIGGDCERTNLEIVASDLRDRRRAAARPAARALRVADHVRRGSARPRPPLCDRRQQDPPRAGLAAAAGFRVGPAADRRVVSGQPALGRARHVAASTAESDLGLNAEADLQQLNACD